MKSLSSRSWALALAARLSEPKSLNTLFGTIPTETIDRAGCGMSARRTKLPTGGTALRTSAQKSYSANRRKHHSALE